MIWSCLPKPEQLQWSHSTATRFLAQNISGLKQSNDKSLYYRSSRKRTQHWPANRPISQIPTTIHQSHIPQHTTLERKCTHFCSKSGISWDMGLVRALWDLRDWYSLFPSQRANNTPDSKIHGAGMAPTWVLSAPGVGPMLAPWALLSGIRKALQYDDVVMLTLAQGPKRELVARQPVASDLLSTLSRSPSEHGWR